MKHRLRRIFILSVIASVGLLCLQGYWIREQWQSGKDILKRQVDYAFRQAISNEWNQRKDSLTAYLEEFLNDTNFIGIGTRYNEKEKVWMITMYDPADPNDFSSWSTRSIPVGEKLLPGQKEQIIEQYIATNVRENVVNDVIFFYTQRFGKVWTKKQGDLKLDTSLVNRLFAGELRKDNITTGFNIRYRDTSLHKSQEQRMSAIYSDDVPVNYLTLNDHDKRYQAFAGVESPNHVLLKRMWLAILSSVVLLSLTLFCLYRMYRTIIRQKQLDELKNDFISNITHELKTPIATVTAAIDGLQYYEGLDDRQRAERYLNTSRSELKKLDEMVSRVLALSASEQPDSSLQKEKLNLHGLLQQVFSSFIVPSSFSWQLIMDEDLKIYGDREKLTSVFQNIIENSIKYAGGELIIIVKARQEAGTAVIEINDNGPGIDALHLPHIFEKFYRVPSAAASVKGFGLGLYYVSRIVLAHGGSISATNEKGLGFVIKLPMKN